MGKLAISQFPYTGSDIVLAPIRLCPTPEAFIALLVREEVSFPGSCAGLPTEVEQVGLRWHLQGHPDAHECGSEDTEAHWGFEYGWKRGAVRCWALMS